MRKLSKVEHLGSSVYYRKDKVESLTSQTKELVSHNAWLDPDDPKCTSDEYFKQISYFVSLEGIFMGIYISRSLYCFEYLLLQQ